MGKGLESIFRLVMRVGHFLSPLRGLIAPLSSSHGLHMA